MADVINQEEASVLRHKEYPSRYDVCLKNGLAACNEKSEGAMNEVFGSLSVDTQKKLRVLSIGCGNGNNDVPIINALIGRYSKIVYDLVEPAEKYLNDVKILIELKKKEWKGVTFIPHLQTMEKFIADKKKENGDQSITYDVIHSLHSIYYFKDQVATVRMLCDWIQKDGLLLLRIGSGNWKNIYAKYCEICKIPEKKQQTAITLMADLKDFPGIEIKRKPVRKRHFKINQCFQEDSEDGNKMLDMIFGVADFRKNVPQEKATFLLGYMKECCEREGDDLFISDNDNDVVITKGEQI
ncbi:histamine N-methyltransferase A-like [Glandiceps talaboti]